MGPHGAVYMFFSWLRAYAPWLRAYMFFLHFMISYIYPFFKFSFSSMPPFRDSLFFFNYLISHLSVPLTFLAFQGDKCTLTEVVANVDIDPYGEYCEWSELSVTQLIKLLFVLL